MRRRGFTLIELLAVIAIFAMLAAIALPNLGVTQSRRVRESARRLAFSLEFTRQRAVMTGTPHRVLMDLDHGSYWIEGWLSGEQELELDADPLDPAPSELQIEMAPPEETLRDFLPIEGPLGSANVLERGVDFIEIETPSGTFQDGEVEVVFGRDGTTQQSRITLGAPDVPAVTLHVAPLADTVHIEHEDS